MNVELLAAPYDSGRRGVRMGAGPEYLLSGLEKRFGQSTTRVVELPNDLFPSETTAAFALARQLSVLVRDARERGAFSLLLTGNCGVAALSAIAGLADSPIGIVWFDAHADFNTPESTRTGFLDGMALSIVTGNCWRGLAATVSGFHPVSKENVVLIGARDLDSAEAKMIAASRISHVPPSSLETAFRPALDSLRTRVSELYVHVDLDVIDSDEGRANTYACRDGLRVSQVLEAINQIWKTFSIRAAALTSYDPAADNDNRIRDAAEKIAVALVRADNAPSRV